jgi:hypothetical protein
MSRRRNRRGSRSGPRTPSEAQSHNQESRNPSRSQLPTPLPAPSTAPLFLRRPWLLIATAVVLALWLSYLLMLYFTTVRPMEHRLAP